MSVRYFDVWSFTEQVPEDCIWGHMSPASAAFLIQMLLSSGLPMTFFSEKAMKSQMKRKEKQHEM